MYKLNKNDIVAHFAQSEKNESEAVKGLVTSTTINGEIHQMQVEIGDLKNLLENIDLSEINKITISLINQSNKLADIEINVYIKNYDNYGLTSKNSDIYTGGTRVLPLETLDIFEIVEDEDGGFYIFLSDIDIQVYHRLSDYTILKQ